MKQTCDYIRGSFFFCNRAIVPFLIFFAVAVIYAAPLFKNINNWGQMDWDQFTFWNAVPRKTILTYHQFPLWNPYSNGGNVLLAHPHSSFLSPFYLLVLIFGPVPGIKLHIIIFLILGLSGMFLFLKHLGLKEIASYAGSFIFMLSSIYPLHLAEGHVEWLGMAFVPWLFLSYVKSIEKREYVYTGILFFTLMILGGNVYISAIMALCLALYSLIRLWQEKRIVWLKNIVIIFLGAFLLSSLKLFPMLEFLSHSPRRIESVEKNSPLLLPVILLDREQGELYSLTKWNSPEKKMRVKNNPEMEPRGQARSTIFGALSGDILSGTPGQGRGTSRRIDYGWHEYGAYVGIIPLLLCAAGIFFNFKKEWPLLLVGIIFLLLSLGGGSPVNLWKIAHSLPVYNALHVPSRLILIFIFTLSIFSGLGLSKIEEHMEKTNGGRPAVCLIALFILFDLCAVNGPILKQAFVIAPVRLKEHAEFRQRYDSANFYHGLSRSAMYPVFLSNSGILDAYEVIHVRKGHVLAAHDPGYRGEVYLASGKGSAAIASFSPNKIVVSVNADDRDTLVLNQNYYKGWRVEGDRHMRAVAFNGVIASGVSPADTTIIFRYRPDSFIMGCIVSGISMLAGLALYARGYMRRICESH